MSRDDHEGERHAAFVLGIQKASGPLGEQLRVRDFNDGMADPEIILLVETWLQQFKRGYKASISGAFSQ